MRKEAKCSSCCPQGGAIFEATWDWSTDPETRIWRCLNCGHTTPRRQAASRPKLEDQIYTSVEGAAAILNPAQKRAIEALIRLVAKLRSNGASDRYEFKKIKIRIAHGGLYLVTEYGRIGDEGTMASVFCRDYRHFAIGARGGVDLLNAKHGKPAGVFQSVLSLTK